MLTLSFSQVFDRLRSTDKALLAVAIFTAIALLYSGNQALSWLGNYNQAGELRLQAEQLETALGNSRVGGESGTTTVDQYVAQLAAVSSSLAFETNEKIIGLLSDLARESRVLVASTTVSGAGDRTTGPVRYEVVTMSVRIEGQLSRIYEYIDLLSDTAPTVAVVSARVGGFGIKPWALLEIEFLVRPQPAPPGSTS